MPRRSEDSDASGCARWSAPGFVETVEARRTVTKSVMGVAFSSFTPGVMSTRTSERTSSGACDVSAMADGRRATSPPRRGPGGQLGDHDRQVAAVLRRSKRAVGPPVGVAMAGEVHGDQGPAQRQRHRVPGVGVLGAPVEQDELGLALPHTRLRRRARGRPRRRRAGRGRTIEGDAVLGSRSRGTVRTRRMGTNSGTTTKCPIPARPGGFSKNASMPERRLSAVVLAAGEGTRMRSERPKPPHLLCGRPMILHVLDAMAEIDVRRVVVVVGHRAEWVTKTLVQLVPSAMRIEFVEQLTQSGTGDAVGRRTDRPARRRRRGGGRRRPAW